MKPQSWCGTPPRSPELGAWGRGLEGPASENHSREVLPPLLAVNHRQVPDHVGVKRGA